MWKETIAKFILYSISFLYVRTCVDFESPELRVLFRIASVPKTEKFSIELTVTKAFR